MTYAADQPSGDATLVMNPHSGGGKVARFSLAERAQAMGARVMVTSPDEDAASLARAAVAEGAGVLGVAGGDGTVAAVAAVAAEAGRPLLVVPAGTRNHFARDLGLNLGNPASALTALRTGVLAAVDLGRVGSRLFINNISFGVYADALLTPGYREAKVRAFAAVAPGYLEGERWIDAIVDTPDGPIDRPQMVLVSNNLYDLSALRQFSRRPALDQGRLGGIVVKHPNGRPPPDLLARVRRELRHGGHSGPHGAGVVTWTSARITLHGTGAQLPAGIDGEAVLLDLPVVCEIRARALQILLPGRAGAPDVRSPVRRK